MSSLSYHTHLILLISSLGADIAISVLQNGTRLCFKEFYFVVRKIFMNLATMDDNLESHIILKNLGFIKLFCMGDEDKIISLF